MSKNTSSYEASCTLTIFAEASALPKVEELRTQLESKDEAVKIEALRQIVFYLMAGENMSRLLMPVIKYCLHTENHTIKRILLIFWEVVEKKRPDGHLLHEMILVCNAMKNNLQHPNEYIRGSTLRFLCTMKEADILESLIPSITANLEHRHSYVRKNAVLAVKSIFEAHPDLIPDAPDLVDKFLEAEQNATCKRNAFLMLSSCAQERAVSYLNSMLDQLAASGEAFQLAALELIRKVCKANPLVKSQYAKCIYGLTNSTSNAVAYEAANTLVALSTAKIALRAAIAAYTRLLQLESDNNVKLIILNRLIALKKRHSKVLEEMLLDMLRTLATPNIDIRKKTMELGLDLVSQRNVDEVIQVLKKELQKSDGGGETATPASAGASLKTDEYRKLLMTALHQIAMRFPEVAATVSQIVLNQLGDENMFTALDVIFCIRDIAQEYPQLRAAVVTKLIDNFEQIRFPNVFRTAFWILGEYAEDAAVLDSALQLIRKVVGDLPLVVPKAADDSKDAAAAAEVKEEKKAPMVSSRPVVLADGTYAQQSAVIERVDTSKAAAAASAQPTVRSMLITNSDFFLAASIANAYTKLALRYCSTAGYGTAESNAEVAQAMLMITAFLRFGTEATRPIERDAHSRLMLCLRTLLDPKTTSELFLAGAREAYAELHNQERSKRQNKDGPAVEAEDVRQADDLISIRQLKGLQSAADADDEDPEVELDRLMGSAAGKGKGSTSKLNRIHQLTGLGDSVYAEAAVTVFGFDIVLDVLIVNQTPAVLQNVTLELLTSRDLKVVERLQSFNLAPHDFTKLRATIKVSSTESGVIFGNIVYDSSSGTTKTIVVLNSIYLDVVDYIRPALCSPTDFRQMWAEFEWENKVAVNSDISEPNEYLQHIIAMTNMKPHTNEELWAESSNFLAVNLYGRSIFGEDALMNLCVERLPGNSSSGPRLVGYIRIRSKQQGIALTLGDKVTNKQRGASASNSAGGASTQPQSHANSAGSGSASAQGRLTAAA